MIFFSSLHYICYFFKALNLSAFFLNFIEDTERILSQNITEKKRPWVVKKIFIITNKKDIQLYADVLITAVRKTTAKSIRMHFEYFTIVNTHYIFLKK